MTCVGYHANWELHHLHHVCLSGGKDGIYVGGEDYTNDWIHKISSAVSIQAWNKDGGRGSMDAMKLNFSNYGDFANHTYVKGNSMLIACHRQLPDLLYPSMWISKLGSVYELARMYANASSDPGFNNTFNEKPPMSFDNMIMHQCADPAVTNWEWGKAVLAIALAQAIDSKMFRGQDDPNPTVISGYFYNERVEELVCFEDLYVSLRANIWLQGADEILSFRKRAAEIVGEPAEVLKKDENPIIVRDKPDILQGISQSYCTTDGTKSKARIKIYQRSAGRRFNNLEEVKKLVQTYSSVPVEVVTANTSTSVADLIQLFNSFDILVSPEGGHLTSGIFTLNPGNKAIVEVSSAVFELLYYKNYQLRLGFLTYILSDGHFTPAPECPWKSNADFERECILDSKAVVGKLPQSYYKCKIKNQKDIKTFRSCDTQVNLEKLGKSLEQMYSVVCPAGGTPAGSEKLAQVGVKTLDAHLDTNSTSSSNSTSTTPAAAAPSTNTTSTPASSTKTNNTTKSDDKKPVEVTNSSSSGTATTNSTNSTR